MERLVNMAVYHLITYMYEYNRLLQYRFPTDVGCIEVRGRIEAMLTYLAAIGFPISYGQGSIMCNRNDKPSKGYAYIMFKCKTSIVNSLHIYEYHGFENGIFWFLDGNGNPTHYKISGRK